MLGWEFFYRGFMTLGLKDSLKEGAILVQMIPFTLLHLGKPMAESVACIPSGLIWGYIAYKGEEFLTGILHARSGQCGLKVFQYWDDLRWSTQCRNGLHLTVSQ